MHELASCRHDQAVQLMRQHGTLLKYAPAASRANKDIVLAAVESSWRALQFASETMQGDPEVVLLAVKQDGWALRWAPLALRNDPKFMAKAIAIGGFDAITFVGKDLDMGSSESGCANDLLRDASQRYGLPGYHRSKYNAAADPTSKVASESMVVIRDAENWDACRLRFGGRFSVN
jgi:hypothetical protein